MIQVNLLTSSNPHYENRLSLTKLALREFFNISSHNKPLVKFVLYCNESQTSKWENILFELDVVGIDSHIVSLPNDDYMLKVESMKTTDCEYMCKWDDDVFINRHVWNYMIENASTVKNSEYSVLAPILTNGIPTVDLFVEDFMNVEEQAYVSSIFLNEGVAPHMWGCSYAGINDAIKNMTSWNRKEYWNLVAAHNQVAGTSLPWYFSIVKGVHPARFSERYNKFIIDFTIRNSDKVFSAGNYYLESVHTPYFCNNLFLTSTEFYKESQTMFYDHWDEGQLTVLSNRLNKTPVYIRNSYGIHMAYGCTANQVGIETEFSQRFFEKYL